MKSSRIRLLAKVKKSQNQNFKGSKQKFKKTQKYQNLPHGPLLSFIKTLRATSSSSLYYLLLLFLVAVVGWLVSCSHFSHYVDGDGHSIVCTCINMSNKMFAGQCRKCHKWERERGSKEWMNEGRLLERKINCFSLRRKGQSNKQNVKQICLERRKKNATFWNLTKSPFLLKCFITFKRVCGLKERFIFYEAQLDYCYKWATSFAVSQAVLSYHYVASKQASLPICS